MDRTRLEDYLRLRMPDRGVDLIGLKRISGGMSRETWFADARFDDGTTERYTVRLNHESGSVAPAPLELEFRVLDSLQRTSVPAAKPLWFEDDAELIGRAPFYVRENVAGTAAFRELFEPGAEKRRARIGRQLAELLAAVHTADWKAAGFGEFMAVPETPEDCALLEMRKYRAHFERNRIEPQPVVAEMLSWLARNAPSSVQRVSLVWGDVGLGNFIFDDDGITALTDWEQAHLGDPMKDWAFALWRGADSLLPREEMFEIYESASGLEVDLDAVAYYRPFINAMNVLTSSSLIPKIVDGHFGDITFARLAMGMPFQCLEDGYAAMRELTGDHGPVT